jgi:hypothetical protein
MVKFEVFGRQVKAGLLPHVMAVIEASRFPDPYNGASIQVLLTILYDEPAQLAARLESMSLADLLQIGQTHVAIEGLVNDFANMAWACSLQDEPDLSSDLVLSPGEHFRFCCAFYRTELFFRLFRGTTTTKFDSKTATIEYDLFFSKYAPWENEQLACVHDFLEDVFFTGSFQDHITVFLSQAPLR